MAGVSQSFGDEHCLRQADLATCSKYSRFPKLTQRLMSHVIDEF